MRVFEREWYFSKYRDMLKVCMEELFIDKKCVADYQSQMRDFVGRSIVSGCTSYLGSEEFKFCSRHDKDCQLDLIDKRLRSARTLGELKLGSIDSSRWAISCIDTYMDLAEKNEKIIFDTLGLDPIDDINLLNIKE